MAEKKPEATGEAKPKGKLLLFIIIGVLVVVLGAGGTFFMLKKKHTVDDEEAAADESPAKTEKAKKAKKDRPDAPPVFVKFDPFTIKLQPEQTEAYLQTTPELRVLDPSVAERVKQFTPAIRHKVLLLLSGKKPSDLSSPQGVQRLSNEIRDAINLILDGPKKVKGKVVEPPPEPTDEADPEDSVQAVLFTSFIIQ